MRIGWRTIAYDPPKSKAYEDALNGIWYKDDSQIVHEYSMKQYARETGVIVKMWGGNEGE